MLKFDNLPNQITQKIESDRANGVKNPYAFCDSKAIRRKNNAHDEPTLLRSNFIRDIDKILNCPFYNRYSDKTQVFSFYKNDDITRRSLHVQLVSRIARTIGKALNLNTELIEAIALGHDLGHTPFGHAGEKILDQILFERKGLHFAHNLQSVRVLDVIFSYNISLQTLDGIAGHNGEIEKEEYHPIAISNFDEFDSLIESCYKDKSALVKLSPSTLEGCVVRISDIIAYLGKDRQDGSRTSTYDENEFEKNSIGNINAEIINNLSVNIIKNSYGKNYLKLDSEYFADLVKAKTQNYAKLYNSSSAKKHYSTIEDMMNKVYDKLLLDLDSDKSSPIFTHHIGYINASYYKREKSYLEQDKERIVADYIASMTDDYFIELYNHLFPKDRIKIEYKGYFE
ncbi:MAG: HD domain-containing protein [Clostridiales bacterium]|nr:HD domain-containing protein [Clostridiales bacterium]